jgi:hypothetical protein
MKPFDLEAAKAGKPIMSLGGVPYTFVGMSVSGDVVVESVSHGKVFKLAPDYLYMIEEKKTYYVNVYRHYGLRYVTVGNATAEKTAPEAGASYEYIKTIEFEA